MRSNFISKKKVKTQHFAILFLILTVVFNLFSKYSIVDIDLSSFCIFVFMCLAAYLSFKSAKEIISSIEEKRYKKEQNLLGNPYLFSSRKISPTVFNSGSRFSKYATSINTQRLKMVS